MASHESLFVKYHTINEVRRGVYYAAKSETAQYSISLHFLRVKSVPEHKAGGSSGSV